MDENKEKRQVERIYSRNKIKLPRIDYSQKSFIKIVKIKKIIKILIVLIIAFWVASTIIKSITPIINAECVSMAKSIATKISNEQATKVMANYNYDDLSNIIKDESGKIKMISSNIITVNKIISDIPILMQEELNKDINNKFYIKLGSFTGSKLLAGRGPNVEIKMATIGNVETDLKSEFSSAGINQTLHRVYLEVRCDVSILTPFTTIQEKIINQVLLAEGVIVGEIPDTYYNLEGLEKQDALEVIE